MRIFTPADVPRDIEDRLKQIDPNFFIKRLKTPNLDSGASETWGSTERVSYVERLAVCLKWHHTDPRWQRVRDGQYSESNAFDMLCTLPADITFEQVPAFLENTLRRARAPSEIMSEVIKWNEDQKLRNGEAVFEYGQEVIDRVNHFRKQGKATAEVPDPLHEE